MVGPSPVAMICMVVVIGVVAGNSMAVTGLVQGLLTLRGCTTTQAAFISCNDCACAELDSCTMVRAGHLKYMRTHPKRQEL
jgi:uncharacterized membrane protein YkgB